MRVVATIRVELNAAGTDIGSVRARMRLMMAECVKTCDEHVSAFSRTQVSGMVIASEIESGEMLP